MEPSQRARVDRPVRPVRTKDRFLDHRPVHFNTGTEPARDRDQSDIGPFFESASYVSTLAILTRIVELISICGILCLRRKEATAMGSIRFIDIQTRPTEVLDLTSLTLDEFQQLVSPFEGAFTAHMAHWRLDGQPRTARRYTTYKNCPLPTPEDRLLFILVYLKTYPLQVLQGRLFGMGQSKAHQWIHVLLVVLQATLRTLGDAPTRSLTELAKRIGVAEADATAMVVPTEELPSPTAPPAVVPTSAPDSPLLAMMAPNGASSAPRIRLS